MSLFEHKTNNACNNVLHIKSSNLLEIKLINFLKRGYIISQKKRNWLDLWRKLVHFS